ncbi:MULTISPECIES: thiamine pyrophosphate-dependent enzyme [Nostocales]|uniref:Pyruvate oxidase n=3 Tax=Nostocales TaxID=1161 RepID=A0A0C1N7D1_9CYAN|nr:thiamine pyrophosphate-dependent enzyme [Tolypothrix bouteillei]KAF3883791.1 pyruvate oxidase [Tolypothrix bouteillei VB521301]
MTTTAADVLINVLHDWGVEVIFGLPGDGINGIMEALRNRQEQIRFIQVRHEEAAAFMACAYAKYTGKLGVCLATSGPGGIHLLNGLYDAKLDGQPVLAITGHHYHDLINTHSQQDVDLDKVFMDVAVYNARVMGPTHVENVANLACRAALNYRSVAHINFPLDFQSQSVEKKGSMRNLPHHVSNVKARSVLLPSNEDLQRAADVLNAGKKIAILAGRGALEATDELEQIAEKLGAPIIKALLGKAAVPDDSPYTTGTIGVLGTKPSQEALETCDTLLIVGSTFPYIEYYPKPGQARGVQIDIDPFRIGLRYPVEVGLVGDSSVALQKLLPLLKRNEDRGFLEQAQSGMNEWRQTMRERGTKQDKPMKPQVVAYELGQRLSDTAIVSADSGTNTTWWARQIPVKRGQMHSVSGTLASMGCGLPYAIAAAIAYPNQESIAFVGDGGFSMLMAEFVTCVKYQLPVKVVIVKNGTLGQIKWEQMMHLGNPEFGCELQPIDFAAFAKACGGTGFTIDNPAHCGAILDSALATSGPVIVEAVVDPLEPQVPPLVKSEEVAMLSQALKRGEPNREELAANIVSVSNIEQVRELI